MTTGRLVAAVLAALLASLSVVEDASRLPPVRFPERLHGQLVAQKAVRYAREVRSDSMEIDLNFAKDGVFVLFHDDDLRGRPIRTLSASAIAPEIESFGDFVEGLVRSGRRFAYIHLDMKPRSLCSREMRLALEAHAESIARLARITDNVVISSPFPAIHQAIHRFTASRGFDRLGVTPILDMVDYDTGDVARWGLPMPWYEGLALPLARAASNAYLRLIRPHAVWLSLLEKTAESWDGPEFLICWSREPVLGRVPGACKKTERH